MYHKYYTDAFVLSHRDVGEADRVFLLYTRDFGAILARASAVRRESSRMRCGLQTASGARVALVRGKRGWRLAGASAALPLVGVCPEGTVAFARIASLLGRLTGSEDAHERVYDIMRGAHGALSASREEGVPSVELLAVARLLEALGYLARHEAPDLFECPGEFLPTVTERVNAIRSELTAAVNASIAASAL